MTKSFDVVVVGAGMAGLSSAAEICSVGRSTLVLVGGLPGGQLVGIESITGLDDHPDGVPGYDLLPSLEERAAQMGVEFDPAALVSLYPVDDGWTVVTSGADITARAVVIATGTRFADLGVPGEVEFAGRGVGHCATCDAPLLRDGHVTVVGGGDSAFQEALTLADAAARVIIVHDGDEPTAQWEFRDRVEACDNIAVQARGTIDAIVGDGTVTGAMVRHLDSGLVEQVATDGVFVYVGQVPNTDNVSGLVELDATGRIVVDDDREASEPGIFAVGTVSSSTVSRAADSRIDAGVVARSVDAHLGAPMASGSEATRDELVVHDPRGFAPEIVGQTLSPRLDSLEGKVVYLVDCLFDNTDVFVSELHDWFRHHHPEVETRIIKPKESWVDDPEMRATIAANGDAAVLAVGL